MLIKNEFEVAEPVEKVWQFFDNIPQVAACLPGAELTEDLGDDKYKGTVAVRMGPVRLQFAGTADITERIAAAAATPAKGVTLGLRAALMALSRVFRRFFLPYQPAS